MGGKITEQIDLKPELTIIIPVYNNWRLTANCLAHIFRSSIPKGKYIITVVDNGSTDMTKELVTYLKDEGEPIIYLRNLENLGFIKANNQAWEIVKTPYLMLLNNDVFVDDACIMEMLKIIKSADNIGIVGALEFLPDGRPSKEKPYIYFKHPDLLDPVLLGENDEMVKVNTEGNGVDVDIVGSACCIIKKEVSDKIGYFDEIFGMAMWEQEDFWLRTKLAGYRIVLCKTAVMTHIVGATTAFDTKYYQQVIKDNKQKFLNKWKDEIERRKNLYVKIE